MKHLKKPTVWIPAIALLVYVLLVFLCPVFVADERKSFLYDNMMYTADGLRFGFAENFSFLNDMPFSFIKLIFQAVIGFWHGLLGLEVIDIRLLSVCYVALTLFALWLIARNLNLRTTLANVITGVLIVLLATSYGLFSYFNTFYREGIVLPLLLLVGAALLQFAKTKGLWAFLLFFFAAAVMVTLGPVPALLAVFFVIAGIRLAFLPMQWWKRTGALVLSLVLLPLSCLGMLSSSVSDYQADLYNAVFYGALMESENPEMDLEEMGLSEELAVYVNTPYFALADKEMLDEEFYPYFNYRKLTAYYFKHPTSFFAAVKQAGNNVYETDISYLRSYDEEAVSPQRFISMPTHWFETLQLRFLPRGVVSWLVYLILFILLACVRRKTLEGEGEKALSDCAVVFAFMPLLLLTATPFVSGLTEISRRLFYTNAVFECFFVLLVAYAAEVILLRRNRLREQYGVNQ